MIGISSLSEHDGRINRIDERRKRPAVRLVPVRSTSIGSVALDTTDTSRKRTK